MAGDEAGRGVDVDDAAVLDDGDSIAEALGLFHEVGGEEDGFAAVANAAYQIPNRPARLGVEASSELVEEDDFRVVDEGHGDEESLLLAAGEVHEPGVALVFEAELVEEMFGIGGLFAVERGPEVDCFPDLDALLELGLLELNADAILELVDLAVGIEAEDGDGARVGLAKAFDALHGGGFARSVGADEAEDLALVDREGCVGDGDGAAVGLADGGDLDDWGHGWR